MSSWSRYPSGDLGLSESSRRQYGWTKSALGHLSGSCPSLCLSYGVSGGQSLRRQGHGCWPLQSEDQQMSPWEKPEELLLSLAPLAGKWTQLSQYPSSSSSRATLQPLGSSSELWEGCPSKAICPEENLESKTGVRSACQACWVGKAEEVGPPWLRGCIPNVPP